MNQHLPSLWSLIGCEDAQGFVFKDPLSAKQWLEELMGKRLSDKALRKRTVTIERAQVIYYGSNLKSDMKTSEQVREEMIWPGGRKAGPPHDK